MTEKADCLPANVRAYKRTAVFDERTIPAALRRRHCTKPGVWGLIQIVDGLLRYRIIETGEESILDARHPGIVPPAQLHEVEPLGRCVSSSSSIAPPQHLATEHWSVMTIRHGNIAPADKNRDHPALWTLPLS